MGYLVKGYVDPFSHTFPLSYIDRGHSSALLFQPTTKAWPLEASGALALGTSARVAAEPDRRREWHGD
eukprot:4661819-Prymnesium_polylepis.1